MSVMSVRATLITYILLINLITIFYFRLFQHKNVSIYNNDIKFNGFIFIRSHIGRSTTQIILLGFVT
jgi:hypothetical protein